MSYCDYVKGLPDDNIHRVYHDTMYGVPIESDDELFGRFILEINQAGLSWDTILKKEANFRTAYSNFSIKAVADYREKDIERLLGNAGIIRNRKKIEAAIYNAEEVLKLQKEYGTFLGWITSQGSLSKEEWVKLFKEHFKFVGGEIVGEFLMSIGVLSGAHSIHCLLRKRNGIVSEYEPKQ